jgi:uncharacterized cupin superfamily protein
MRRFNILAPEFDHGSERDGYCWRGARIGSAVGGEDIGACLYELGEGECSYPYHFHHGIEEWLLVVDGSPRLRTPGGERELRKGDMVAFPVGPGGAHQLTGPGTVLMFSSKSSPEVTEYPDSGKVGASPPRAVFRIADAVDYWDGE